MDRNSAIGFGLLMALLIVYIVFNQSNEPKKKPDTKQKTELAQDSTAQNAVTDTAANQITAIDSSTVENAGEIVVAEQKTSLENEDVKITFTNKGAYPTKVELKNYKTYSKEKLMLFTGDKNFFNFEYQKNGLVKQTKAQSFNATVDAGGKKVTFAGADGFSITYTLPEKGFMSDIQINTGGIDKSKDITFFWNGQSLHTEKDKAAEKMYTEVCYNLEGEGYDDYTITEKETENFEGKGIKWLSFKQHFFNTTIVPADGLIKKGEVTAEPDADSSKVSNFAAKLSVSPEDQLNFQLYTGPNDYDILKSYDNGMQEIVPLAYGIFSFVKYINLWLIIPLFTFLSGVFSNMGVVIIVLTFIIRLLMSPFTYKSYVSSAKMKALKPELDELKEQYKDDKQAFGVEQMKLYKTAGVNPLGGCLPALLQMPIFFALFSFFPHAIQLRQKAFAWADDLSSYDSIVSWTAEIPLISSFYGNHVSLFTILFALTSVLLALYSMSNATMDQSNPVMKYMPFIMPIMFLGIFNKFAAALTLYYFVSNLITLGLQFIIQNYIIDKDKIRAKILAKKNEPAKESKFMKKMKELQEKQADQAQTRSQRRK